MADITEVQFELYKRFSSATKQTRYMSMAIVVDVARQLERKQHENPDFSHDYYDASYKYLMDVARHIQRCPDTTPAFLSKTLEEVFDSKKEPLNFGARVIDTIRRKSADKYLERFQRNQRGNGRV